MAYEIVKKLECITNKTLDGKEIVNLTIGEIYDSAYSNSTPNSEVFGVFNDEGILQEFSKRFFKIKEIITRENTGWKIECKDCCKNITLNELIENNYRCPRCNQEFKINKKEVIKDV